MKPEEAVLRRLYLDEQKSLAEIGRLYEKDRKQVQRWLIAYGIERRDIRTATMLTGKYGVHSDAHRESLRKNAAIARSKITPEHRKKQGIAQRGKVAHNKGKPMAEAQRQQLIEQRSDPEYRRKMSERMTGELSPNWKGGIKSELARRLDTAEWRRMRVLVYERDGWLCQDCGCRCLNTRDAKLYPKRKIQAHHVVPRRYGGADELSNLVTLCMSCHHKRERGLPAPS